ncbi:hypothetical protein GQ55_1G088600 [Panicum hallii var. hallii]|uniref:Uncharacterized protein n=1 Tax=Panicum hallii var. hallii TaxID=1504633 RepID=A0A2T7F3Q9_9POAL|nr:hypothetical protein GQ55_1G088600 [Panicum hallii var. hallii]
MGLSLNSLQNSIGIEQLWTVNPLMERCSRIKSTVLTCILWNIRKCRNAEIFRHEDETNLMISRRCRDDLILWSNRCSSPSDRAKLVGWSKLFPM